MKPWINGLLLILAAFTSASQAGFPERPIRLVVAFAPGSSTDIVARLIAKEMSATIGQPVVVENKPGAGGNIATQGVMSAAGDGYTLLFHSVAYSVNPSLFANAGYDPIRDLRTVAVPAVTPNLLYVHPDVKARSLAELIELARQSPMAYASSGNGTTTHLGAELLFRSLSRLEVTHVPHQPAAATNAVVSGQVPIASTSMPPAVPFVKNGRVRPIAVMSLRRSPALPEVPTVAEAGYPGFEANTWFGVFAPASTPAATLDALNAEINRALGAVGLRERFETLSLEGQASDRAQAQAYVASEVAKWGKLVREIGLKVD